MPKNKSSNFCLFLSLVTVLLYLCQGPIITISGHLQSFGGRPSVFISPKYTRGTKPEDAMYAWLENVNSKSFEVCIREFLPFEGKHQDTIVVGKRIGMFYFSSSEL